jgi:hypothetical protein
MTIAAPLAEDLALVLDVLRQGDSYVWNGA